MEADKASTKVSQGTFRTHDYGSKRYGADRWHSLAMLILNKLKAAGVKTTDSPRQQHFIADLALDFALKAWGDATAHSVDKYCTAKSAGIVVRNSEGKYLMLQRATGAVGIACPTGHVDPDEDPLVAALRECLEETGVLVLRAIPLFGGRLYEQCKRQGFRGYHDWYVYEAVEFDDTSLHVNIEESKRLFWATEEELRFFAKRTQLYMHHQISEEEFNRFPGLEVAWYVVLVLCDIVQEQSLKEIAPQDVLAFFKNS